MYPGLISSFPQSVQLLHLQLLFEIFWYTKEMQHIFWKLSRTWMNASSPGGIGITSATSRYFKAPETPVYIRDPYKYADPPTTPPTKALDPIVANYPYLTTNLGNLSIGVLVPKNTSADRLTNVTTAPSQCSL